MGNRIVGSGPNHLLRAGVIPLPTACTVCFFAVLLGHPERDDSAYQIQRQRPVERKPYGSFRFFERSEVAREGLYTHGAGVKPDMMPESTEVHQVAVDTVGRQPVGDRFFRLRSILPYGEAHLLQQGLHIRREFRYIGANGIGLG